MTDEKKPAKEPAKAPEKAMVYLATWNAPGEFHAWGESFTQGVQKEVTKDFAKKMEANPNLDIVYTEEGSKEDVRVPEYVVPPQPDEDPIDPNWPVTPPN